MKLGWEILNHPDKLWVRVLMSKYLKETGDGPQLRRKTGGSALWRGIRAVWHDLRGACHQNVRNGKDTLFWSSRWLDSDIILADHAIGDLSGEDLQLTVAEARSPDGSWNWELLRRSLPPHIIGLVAGMEPSGDNLGEDGIIWGPDPRGKFTLKTAYEILASAGDQTEQDIWRTVWRWAGPSRVRHFLWLVAHDRILSNAERRRRHMADVDDCQRCRTCTEDTLHAVRDCQVAREVWSTFVPPELASHFFSDSLQVWLQKGLRHVEFGLAFGIIIWVLWKARNEAIFENKLATCDQLRLRVLHWIAGVRETMRADSQVISKGATRRIDTHIGWKAGPSDCITINTDGSVLQPHSRAAAGDILRTFLGRPVSTFAANLGRCSIMRAELRAAEIGLKIAWDMGYKKVHLQLDSLAAVTAILGDQEEDSRHGRTLESIDELRNRNWEITISHIFREELVNAIKVNIFYANFSIGYPPVPQLGVMDTGSDFLWVKCLPCSPCSSSSGGTIFDPTKSKTYSSEGVEATEQLTFQVVGGPAVVVPNFTIGCSSSMTGVEILGQQFNGILPLGITKNHENSLVAMFGYKFSYCVGSIVDREARDFPPIGIQFVEEGELVLDNFGMFKQVEDDKFCLAFLRTDSVSLIGMMAQQGYNIGYDLVRKRLYIKDTDCLTV
ncbi:Putative ribonuclease H protein At1g65750 [Linum perenne]